MAANEATYLHFDAPIDRASVEVEGQPMRFQWVDVGERIVAVQPSADLDAEEKLVVRVRYKDGALPVVAMLALVTRPEVVDKEVLVVRRLRTLEALEAALAEKEAELLSLKAQSGAGGPAGLVFSGRLDIEGVQARRIKNVPSDPQDGLEVVKGQAYRTGAWTLAVVRVRNLPGQKPWVPGEARLIRADGPPVKVRSLDMDQAQLAPGEEGVIAVETEAPFWRAEEVLRLELVDKSGSRRLTLPDVRL